MMNFIKPKINGCINKLFKECIGSEEFVNVIIKDNEIAKPISLKALTFSNTKWSSIGKSIVIKNC